MKREGIEPMFFKKEKITNNYERLFGKIASDYGGLFGKIATHYDSLSKASSMGTVMKLLFCSSTFSFRRTAVSIDSLFK